MGTRDTVFYYQAWVERIEQEVEEAWPRITSGEEVSACESFVSSSAKLARDFEVTYQLDKQTALDEDSINLYRTVGNNTIWLTRPTIHFPYSINDEPTGELSMNIEDLVLARYLDIQAGATRMPNGDEYKGPHLICEVEFGAEIQIEDMIIPEGFSIGYVPFKQVRVDFAENTALPHKFN